MSLPDETGNSPIEPERDYFCVSGQAVASKLGRALLAFRDSPDPGNRIADALGEKAKAQAKTAKLKASRSAMGKKRHLQGVVALGGFIPAEHQESPSGFQTEAPPKLGIRHNVFLALHEMRHGFTIKRIRRDSLTLSRSMRKADFVSLPDLSAAKTKNDCE